MKSVWYTAGMSQTLKSTPKKYVVYMLLCGDNTFYTGITNDLPRRFSQHKTGTGSRYTKAKGVKAVVFVEVVGTRSQALRREAAIKKLPLAEKLDLISNVVLASSQE